MGHAWTAIDLDRPALAARTCHSRPCPRVQPTCAAGDTHSAVGPRITPAAAPAARDCRRARGVGSHVAVLTSRRHHARRSLVDSLTIANLRSDPRDRQDAERRAAIGTVVVGGRRPCPRFRVRIPRIVITRPHHRDHSFQSIVITGSAASRSERSDAGDVGVVGQPP